VYYAESVSNIVNKVATHSEQFFESSKQIMHLVYNCHLDSVIVVLVDSSNEALCSVALCSVDYQMCQVTKSCIGLLDC